MRTSNVVLLAEIDILESRIGIDANELETVKEFDRMADEIADLIAVLSNTINGWDCEEVAHHCGVDAETASRVINLLNK